MDGRMDRLIQSVKIKSVREEAIIDNVISNEIVFTEVVWWLNIKSDKLSEANQQMWKKEISNKSNSLKERKKESKQESKIESK